MVQRAGMLAPVLPQIAPTGNPQRHFGAILREILETYSPVRVGADRMQAWRRLSRLQPPRTNGLDADLKVRTTRTRIRRPQASLPPRHADRYTLSLLC